MIRFHPGRDLSFLILATLVLLLALPRSASPSRRTPGSDRAPAPVIQQDDGTWLSLVPGGTLPPARYGHSAVFDAGGDRMIIFGGDGPLGDTWSLSLSGTPTWTNLNPAHAPSPRRGAAMIYDPLRNRIVLFGGSDGSPYNDLWALSLTGTPDWTQLSPAGLAPPPRMAAAYAYDPLRDRLVVFGGYTTAPGVLGDAWELRFSTLTWAPLTTTGTAPSPRWGTTSFYDSIADRLVVVFGSTSIGYDMNREVWALSLAGIPSWSQLTPIGGTPFSRALAAGVFDPAADRMIVFGGWDGAPLDDQWQLTLGSRPQWTQMSPLGTLPTARRWHSAIYRSSGTPMVIFGGRGGAGDPLLNDSEELVMGPPGPPVITGFAPLGGLAGDEVIVSGNDFTDATDVSFNGVSAPIEEISSVQIRTRVPAGATTGPIAVTTPLGSVTSTIDFFIGDPPVILAADPDSGKAGASITITGRNFATTMQVSFGGLGIATFVVASDTMISAVVDTLARTGPIYVTNLVRTGSSAFNFTFIPRNPRPELIAVRDVPNDQGGKLIVAWEASEYDRSDYRGITSYRVWRRTYVRTATPARAAGEVRAGSDFGADAVGHVPRGLAASEFWESLAEVPATWLAGYAFAAATLQDSTVAGNPYTAFFVQALTADRTVFYNSNVDSGYSVDNLAPPQPLPFAAVYSGVDVTLHWVKNAAPDFAEFRLYRGTRPDFTPGSANLVIATADTGHVDVPPSPSTAYYKLAAVDIHGNASRFSAVSPEIPVATLASFVSFQAGPDRIRLTWYSGAALDQPATVERRTGAVGWSRVGDVTADGSGFLVYDDSAVTPGARYGYRLGITSDGAEEFLGEVWVTAASPHVALEGARPNPGSSRLLTVWFELSSGAPARVELLDLAGRRVVEREVGSLGPGPHSVNLASGARLAPGVYHVRLTQGQSRETARVVVID